MHIVFQYEKKKNIFFFYEFKLDRNLAETARNINSAFGEETTNERTLQRWFQNFEMEIRRCKIRKVKDGKLPLKMNI